MAHVNNDKDTHKDKYKDKEKRKLPRRKGSCIKAKLLCVAIYLRIHQSFAQFTMSSFRLCPKFTDLFFELVRKFGVP